MVRPLWVAKAIPIPVAQEEAASSGFGSNRLFGAVQRRVGFRENPTCGYRFNNCRQGIA
jgi:hypothetical protein